MKGRKRVQIALAICFLVACGSTASAQEATGRVLGTVTDQSGALLTGARVTVTNSGTGLTRETVTDKSGTFQVLSLPIGNYQVSVEHQGFKKEVTVSQKLGINQDLRFDIKMEVGAPAEIVTVTSAAVGVESVNPTLGESVTSRPLVNLPLNGRNVLDLALLQPGVTENNPDDTSAGRFNIGGGRSDSVTFLLDGGINNNLLNNGVVFNPNPDTVAEFRILENNYTSEYGRNGGGVISVVTKSGKNQFFGSGFEFLRNDAFNANSFFNKEKGLPKDVLKRNQFGFTVGGPITIPHVVNGENRFFFFAGYQGQRQVAGQTDDTTTFTPAELAGDFSHAGPGGGPDPNVVSFLQTNTFFQPNPALAAQGIIDPTLIDPVAQSYIKNNLIPTSPTGDLRSQGSSVNNSDELTLRFDVKVDSMNDLAVTLGANRNPTLFPFGAANQANFTSNVTGFPVSGNTHDYYSNFSLTSTFSPTLLNEFHFTAQRNNTLQAQPAVTLPTASALGVGITPDKPTGPPALSFGSGLTTGFSPQGPTTLINNTFSWSDNLTWIKGRHNWKFGGGFSAYQNNTVFDFFGNGQFTFSGPAVFGGIGSNNDLADFLFGLPNAFLQFGNAASDIRSKSFYGFAQDEWHVRTNLVLTLGLRYEYSQPKFDTNGRSFSIVPGQRSTRFPNAPLGLLFPGDPQAPKGANFPDRNDFAPRFGFAWSPGKAGKTSVRGGFGVFYDILKGEDNLQFNGQAPFFGFAFLGFPAPGNGPAGILSDPFGAAGSPNPFPSRPPGHNIDFGAAGFLPFGGGGVFFVDPHLRTPYTYQYDLSIQREIAKNLVAEAAYVGSSSHKLTSLVDLNPFILGTTHRVLNTLPGNSDSSFSFIDEFQNVANATYNSLQLSLQKRLSNTRSFGTTYFTLAYTLAHSIDNASGFRNRNFQVPAYNPKLFRADSDFDIRQRLTFSGGWDLPFDRLWSSGPGRLTRGWSLYPILSYRTGFPLDVSAGIFQSGGDPGPSGAGDANLVHVNIVGSGPVVLDPKSTQSFGAGNFYFNPSTLTTNGLPLGTDVAANPALRTYGTLPRNSFRGPSRTNLDLAFAKTTPIFRERINMEMRAEFFNIFNHTEFFNPSPLQGLNISSPLFGQITNTYDPRIIQLAMRLTFQ